jgi:hypothetical protein
MQLKLSKEAERELRQEIADQFRIASSRFRSEQAAAEDLGISRQRFRKYLEKQMTPKADVVLLALAKWNLKLTYQGIRFAASALKAKAPAPSSQLRLNFFDAPQLLRNREGNVRLKVARKEADTLKLSLEITLAS